MDEGLEERPIIIRQQTVSVPDSIGAKGRKEEDSLRSNEKISPSPPVSPYQPRIPYPQRLVRSKLQPRMLRFLYLLKKLNINVPFLEILKEALFYLKFLRELLSKRSESLEALVVFMENLAVQS